MTPSRISSAVFIQTQGLGSFLVCAKQLTIACSRASVLRCAPRLRCLRASLPNNRSTLLIHEALGGVQCT